MRHTIPAVGYLRRSTERQDKSIEDQQHEVEAYAAKNGYRLVRFYVDDGISGDATDKRLDFQRMIADARNGRDFDVIIVWKTDRFGRFDSVEAGEYVGPLRRAGVRLVSVTDGEVDWHDFAGRMMYAITQEGNHQFLIGLSQNVLRGQIRNAKAGNTNGCRPPYGYDRMLLDENGNDHQRLEYGKPVARPRGWKVRLVPSDDPVKVETVRWLFDSYANQDLGLRALADDLNHRGVPGPSGGRWWVTGIKGVLTNPAYTGDLVWARHRKGKYHHGAGGEINKRTGGARSGVNDPANWIVHKDAHEPLVDRKTWQRVQEKLVERRGRNTSWKKRNGDGYVLSGLIYCGHCGRKMHGTMYRQHKGGKTYRYYKFVCPTYQKSGVSSGCRYHSVHQRELLAVLLRKLRDRLTGGDVDALRKRLRKRLTSGRTTPAAEVKRMKKRLAELEREIKQGAQRLLRAPDDITDLLAPQLSAWRKERDGLADQIEQTERPVTVKNVEAEVAKAVAKLERLDEELQSAKPARLRELMRRMVDRVDLWWDHVPQGNRVLCPFSKGSIELRSEPTVIGDVQSARSICPQYLGTRR